MILKQKQTIPSFETVQFFKYKLLILKVSFVHLPNASAQYKQKSGYRF